MNTTTTPPTHGPPDCFEKAVVIKEGTATFTHNKKNLVLVSPCFADLEGKTVLINSGMEVHRGGRKIGDASKA